MKGSSNLLVWCNEPPQQVAARKGEKSPLKSGGEPTHSNSHPNSYLDSHTHSALRAHQSIFVLFTLAIVLTIATTFTEVFDLEVCEFCGFNDVFNDLDDEFESEKSGLNNNEYDLCDVSSSPVFDTLGAAADISPTGVRLTGFGDLEYYLIGVLSAPVAVTNENETKLRFDSDCTLLAQCTQTQTQQQNTAAAIDGNDKKCTTGIGLCDFNSNEYVFAVCIYVLHTVLPANDIENEIKTKIHNYNLQLKFVEFEPLGEMNGSCDSGSSGSYNCRSSRRGCSNCSSGTIVLAMTCDF